MPIIGEANLVLIEQVLGCVGHASSVVLNAEGMLRPLRGDKSRMLDQARPQRVGEILHPDNTVSLGDDSRLI